MRKIRSTYLKWILLQIASTLERYERHELLLAAVNKSLFPEVSKFQIATSRV